MGRAPCCDKANVKKGPWSQEEDTKLKGFIEKHGTGGNWLALPHKAGLKRCGKSCRLRWLNYLRPNIKHGEFSDEEDRVICTLFASIGSRWSIIASQLPGRTDNDIKNYWNTKLKKKLMGVVAPSRMKPNHYHNNHHHQQQQLVFPSAAAYPSSQGLEVFQISHQQDSVTAATAPSFLQASVQDSGSCSSRILMFGGDQQSCSYGQGMEYRVGDGEHMVGFEGYLYGGGAVESQKGDGLWRGGPLEHGFDEIKQWWVQQHDLYG